MTGISVGTAWLLVSSGIFPRPSIDGWRWLKRFVLPNKLFSLRNKTGSFQYQVRRLSDYVAWWLSISVVATHRHKTELYWPYPQPIITHELTFIAVGLGWDYLAAIRDLQIIKLVYSFLNLWIIAALDWRHSDSSQLFNWSCKIEACAPVKNYEFAVTKNLRWNSFNKICFFFLLDSNLMTFSFATRLDPRQPANVN